MYPDQEHVLGSQLWLSEITFNVEWEYYFNCFRIPLHMTSNDLLFMGDYPIQPSEHMENLKKQRKYCHTQEV